MTRTLRTETAIGREIDRNYRLLMAPNVRYGSELWNVLYTTQQALMWALGLNAMSPVTMTKKFKKDYSNESKRG